MKGCGSFIGPLLFFLLLGGPLLAASLDIDMRGAVAPGEVRAKQETISVRYGNWTRRTSIEVSYRPAEQPFDERTSIEVNPATYDRLHEGSEVAVRYQPNPALRSIILLPTARLAQQSTMSAIVDRLPANAAQLGLLAAGGLMLLVVWRGLRLKIGGWLLAAYVAVIAVYLALASANYTPPEPRATANATVREIHETRWRTRSSRSGRSIRPDPFDVIELEFVPPGMRDPVVAVDEVDLASGAQLEKGAQTTISYSVANPREAEIVGAAHPSYWGYLLRNGVYVVVLLVVVLALSMLDGQIRRRRRAARAGNRAP
jgi:hypothetical protein